MPQKALGVDGDITPDITPNIQHSCPTLITRGGEASSVGYGTYVVLAENTAHYQTHQLTLEELESNMGGWLHLPTRTLTCMECSRLQGCPGPTTGVFGQGKHAHQAWGEAVAIPCAQTVCGAALHAAGYATTATCDQTQSGGGLGLPWSLETTNFGDQVLCLEL